MNSSQSTVGGYETGKSEPDVATFERLAKTLEVPVEWLAFGIGTPDKDGPVDQVALERHKYDHLFSFAFSGAARLFEEEGIKADIAYLGQFTAKLLRRTQGAESDADAQESIRSAIDAERQEIRADMDILRKKRL